MGGHATKAGLPFSLVRGFRFFSIIYLTTASDGWRAQSRHRLHSFLGKLYFRECAEIGIGTAPGQPANALVYRPLERCRMVPGVEVRAVGIRDRWVGQAGCNQVPAGQFFRRVTDDKDREPLVTKIGRLPQWYIFPCPNVWKVRPCSDIHINHLLNIVINISIFYSLLYHFRGVLSIKYTK